MIRELRRWHRRIFFVMAIVLPLLVLIGLAVRRSIPTMDQLPVSVASPAGKTE